jgi:ABC-type Na+ efflux pump permease subunit
MRLWKSWIVTKKDLSVFKRNRYILYSLVALPLILGVVLPIIFVFSLEAEAAQLTRTQLIEVAQTITNLGSTYFVIIPAALASIIGSYSFVGEKIERSLEPLLATPTTDGELLLGKSLAAFIPCMGVTYIGIAIFSVLIDGWVLLDIGNFPNSKHVLGNNNWHYGAAGMRLKR